MSVPCVQQPLASRDTALAYGTQKHIAWVCGCVWSHTVGVKKVIVDCKKSEESKK